MPESWSDKDWVSRVSTESRRVILRSLPNMRGERAIWDPLLGEMYVAEDIVESEAQEIEKLLLGLQKTTVDKNETIELLLSDDKKVQVPTLETVQKISDRLAILRDIRARL